MSSVPNSTHKVLDGNLACFLVLSSVSLATYHRIGAGSFSVGHLNS